MSPQRDLEALVPGLPGGSDMTQIEMKIPEDLGKETGSTKAMNSHFKCTQQPRWGWRRGCCVPWSLNIAYLLSLPLSAMSL